MSVSRKAGLYHALTAYGRAHATCGRHRHGVINGTKVPHRVRAKWMGACTRGVDDPLRTEKYESAVSLTAPEGEMKVSLVLGLMLLAAASVVAYGTPDVARGVSSFTFVMTEPAYMLLSGTVLLLLAGALRRLSV